MFDSFYLQGKKEQIMAIGEDPGLFKELGILIDPEVAIKSTLVLIIITIVVIINMIIVFITIIINICRLEREEKATAFFRFSQHLSLLRTLSSLRSK